MSSFHSGPDFDGVSGRKRWSREAREGGRGRVPCRPVREAGPSSARLQGRSSRRWGPGIGSSHFPGVSTPLLCYVCLHVPLLCRAGRQSRATKTRESLYKQECQCDSSQPAEEGWEGCLEATYGASTLQSSLAACPPAHGPLTRGLGDLPSKAGQPRGLLSSPQALCDCGKRIW